MAISARTSDKVRIIGLLMTVVVVVHTSYTLQYVDGIAPAWLRWPENFVHLGLRLLAVPFFFVCSGFFLADRADFIRAWPGEVRKRVRSLLVPYVLWCAAWIAIMWGLQQVPALASAFGRDPIHPGDVRQIATLMLLTPIPHPLWYLRDLFVLTLLSPAIVWLLRRGWGATLWFAASLAIFYSQPALLVREVQDLVFFGAGIWLALHRALIARLPPIALPVKLALASASIALMALHVWWIDRHAGDARGCENPWIIDTAAIIGLPALWLLYDEVEPLLRRPALLALSRYALFIYLAHAPALEMARKVLVLRVGHGPVALLLIWLGIALGAIAGCTVVAMTLEHVAPALLAVLTGGRTTVSSARAVTTTAAALPRSASTT